MKSLVDFMNISFAFFKDGNKQIDHEINGRFHEYFFILFTVKGMYFKNSICHVMLFFQGDFIVILYFSIVFKIKI